MTNKKFWAKLEAYVKQKKSIWEISELLEIAYMEDLDIICGCEMIDEQKFKQFYVSIDYKNINITEKFVLCYTDFKKARKDTNFKGKGEIIPIREVIDNIIDNDDVDGMVINPNPRQELFIIDRGYLVDHEEVVQDAMKKMLITDPELFGKIISQKYPSAQ